MQEHSTPSRSPAWLMVFWLTLLQLFFSFVFYFFQTSEESDDVGEVTRQAQAARKKLESKPATERSRRPMQATQPSDALTQSSRVASVGSTVRSAGGTMIVGQTPPAIRHQHFTRLARQLDMTEKALAEAVVLAGEDQRCVWLQQLYSREIAGEEHVGVAPMAVTSIAAPADHHGSTNQDPTVSSSGRSQHCHNEVEVGAVKAVPSSYASTGQDTSATSRQSLRGGQSISSRHPLFCGQAARTASGSSRPSEEILVPESSLSCTATVTYEPTGHNPDLATAVPNSLSAALPSQTDQKVHLSANQGEGEREDQHSSLELDSHTSASQERRDLELAELLFG